MTAKTLAKAALASAMLLIHSPAFAGDAGESLVSCYNHVIQACSDSDNPYCTSGGLNACDDYHSTHSAEIPASLLGTIQAKRAQAASLVQRARTSKATMQTKQTKPARANQ